MKTNRVVNVSDEDFERATEILKKVYWARRIIQRRFDYEIQKTPLLVKRPELKQLVIDLDNEFDILAKNKNHTRSPARLYVCYLIRMNYYSETSNREVSQIFNIYTSNVSLCQTRIPEMISNKRAYKTQYEKICEVLEFVKSKGFKFKVDGF